MLCHTDKSTVTPKQNGFRSQTFAFLVGVGSMFIRVSFTVGQTQRECRSSNNVILFVLFRYDVDEMSQELNSFFLNIFY